MLSQKWCSFVSTPSPVSSGKSGTAHSLQLSTVTLSRSKSQSTGQGNTDSFFSCQKAKEYLLERYSGYLQLTCARQPANRSLTVYQI